MSIPPASMHEVARIAARQHGNVTIEQLRGSGLTPNQVARRVEAGSLIQRHSGVYAVGHRPQTRESRWHAAVLALGPGAVLSHRAAGAMWGIVRGGVPTEVSISPATGRTRRDGIVVHRTNFRPGDVVWRDGIPVTSLLRTILDLAAVQKQRKLERSFEQAQVLHGLKPEVVAVEVICRRRHRGNGRLRLLLIGAVDPTRVRSILELRFLRMCQAQSVLRPLVNERIGPWVVDFLWAAAMVVVETDGKQFHSTPAQRRRDAEKDAYLRGLGYTVLRLTWRDVVENSTITAQVVREALEHPDE